jgi:hypothetical protein
VDVRIVPRPCLEPAKALGSRQPFRLVQERRRHAVALMVRMRRDVPDHPAEPFAVRANDARLTFELDVDQSDDLVPFCRDELDRRAVVARLLQNDVVVVRRAEE